MVKEPDAIKYTATRLHCGNCGRELKAHMRSSTPGDGKPGLMYLCEYCGVENQHKPLIVDERMAQEPRERIVVPGVKAQAMGVLEKLVDFMLDVSEQTGGKGSVTVTMSLETMNVEALKPDEPAATEGVADHDSDAPA